MAARGGAAAGQQIARKAERSLISCCGGCCGADAYYDEQGPCLASRAANPADGKGLRASTVAAMSQLAGWISIQDSPPGRGMTVGKSLLDWSGLPVEPHTQGRGESLRPSGSALGFCGRMFGVVTGTAGQECALAAQE